MFKNNLRLLIEFIVIISGVLLSFYINDVRELQNKKLEKLLLEKFSRVEFEKDLMGGAIMVAAYK